MEIGNSYSASNIFDLAEIQKADSKRKYSSISSQTTPSGDTVDISDEAKELFSKAIHKYDKTSTNEEGEVQDQPGDTGGESAGGAGGAGGSSSSTDSVESIKNQIQSLKSQLSALAGQVGNGADSAALSKMNALQAQISALEAQLNALQQA